MSRTYVPDYIPGNIDLADRGYKTAVNNKDGSVSSNYTHTFLDDDGYYTVAPGVVENGPYDYRVGSPQDSRDRFNRTGEFFGKFRNLSDSEDFAHRNHLLSYFDMKDTPDALLDERARHRKYIHNRDTTYPKDYSSFVPSYDDSYLPYTHGVPVRTNLYDDEDMFYKSHPEVAGMFTDYSRDITFNPYGVARDDMRKRGLAELEAFRGFADQYVFDHPEVLGNALSYMSPEARELYQHYSPYPIDQLMTRLSRHHVGDYPYVPLSPDELSLYDSVSDYMSNNEFEPRKLHWVDARGESPWTPADRAYHRNAFDSALNKILSSRPLPE